MMKHPMPVVPRHDHHEDLFDDDNIIQLPADVQIGTDPATPGTGGVWATAYDSPDNTILCMAVYKGKLYAGSNAGNIYVYNGAAWALAFDTPGTSVNALCVFGDRLFAGITHTYGADVNCPVIYAFDGETWATAHTISNVSYAPACYGLGVLGGVLFAGLSRASYYVSSSTTGEVGSWTATTGIANEVFSFTLFHGELYASSQATSAAIYKWTGAAWTKVDEGFSGNHCYAIYAWNGKIYGTGDGGKVRASATGASGSWATVFESGAIGYAFIEYNGKLLVACTDKLYQTSDGVTWTLFYDSPAAAIHCLYVFEDVLYAGTSSGGVIFSYTDTTLVSAPGLKTMGNVEFYGQFRPGGAPGVAGNIPLSGGPSFMTWLPNGQTGQYLAGPIANFRDLLADVTAGIVCSGGEIVTCNGEVVYGT